MGILVGTSRAQTTGTYTDTNGGNWSDTASWSGGVVPNGIDDIANLLNVIAANSTVTLNVPVTLGTLNFGDTSQSYTIAGSGSNVLTFDVSTGAAQLNFGSGGNTTANNIISAGIVLNDQLDIVLNDTGSRQALTLSGIISTGVGGPAAGAVALNVTNPTEVPTGSSTRWNELIMTGANTFTGQVVINSGSVRYETSNRAAGASGVGNETIVLGSGRLDLRGLNFKQSASVAEIFRLNGHGLYNAGALVNSTGVAAINQLILDGNSTINSESRIDMRQVEGGGALATLDMGGFTLNKFGEQDFALVDTIILNPGIINVYEGELRFESSSPASANPTMASGLTINIAYNPNRFDGVDPANGTRTSGDPYAVTNISDTTGNALFEARIEFYNQNVTHTGLNINLNRGSIDRSGVTTTGTSFNTILDATSTITLVGGTVRDNFFNIAGGSSAYNSAISAYDDPGALIIEGEIVGDSSTGITKRGNRELRLTNANENFTGTFLIKQNPGRYLPTGFQTGGGQVEKQWASVALSGASGGLTKASKVEITRSATLWLDNTAANSNDRLNDLGIMDLKNGYLLLSTNASVTNTENFGNVHSSVGTNKLFIDTRAGGRADISLESLNISEGSVLKIAHVNSTATWGTAAGTDRIALNDLGSITLVGNASGSMDRAIVLGAFGSISPGAGGATVTRPLAALENAQARSNVMARLLTVENVGGVDYLRPLLNSEYDTSTADPSANANWMITGSLGTFGNKNNAINISTSRAINSITVGDTSNDNSNGEYVRIKDGETLTINSGIINFANYGFGNAVNTEASVRGGMISMNGRMAIINSGSFWEDLDRNEANYYNYLSGNSAYMRSTIINANGLLKTGRNNLYLDTWNQFIAGSKAYVTDEASLVVRHSGALGGISEVVITGQGNFLLQGGVNITGTDIRVTPLDTDRVILRSESHHNTWGGNIILDTVDSSGSKENQRHRLTALANATLTVYGDIYVDPTASANATASDLWDDSFILAHDSTASGIVNLRGRVMDLPTGPLGMPVNVRGDTATTIDRNHALRFQISGADDANLNVFQQWNATGRIDIRQGYFRVLYDPTTSPDGTGFLSDTARSRILANDYLTRLVLGGDGSTAQTYHSHLMLTRDGQVINHPYLYSHNDNRNGTQTIGGENRSGTVYLGSSDNSVNFGLQFVNQGGDRDVRFLQVRGGTMVFNGRLDDEGTSVNSSISVVGPGTVRFNGNAIGTSDVERWNFIGGSTIWGNHLGNNRFALSSAVSTFGGGTLTLEAQASAFSQSLSGNIYLLAGSGGIEAQNNTTLTLGSGTAVLTRRSGSTLAFTESGNGVINFTSASGTPSSDGDRFDSWAVYGSALNNITDWAARSGTSGVQAFAGYANDTFTSGSHTNVTTNAVLGGSTSTASIRFGSSASIDLGGAGNTLTVENGGILIPTSVSGSVNIGNGNLTSAWASGNHDLVVHNYGTGTTTISAAIVDNGTDKVNLVHSGTGTTVLEADNTFTGDMHINGGVVSISSEDQLGNVSGTIERLILMNGGGSHSNNVSGGTLIFNTSNAPGAAATGTFNTNGTGNVSSVTLTGGGSGYTSGVWVQSETGASGETYAGIWAIMNSGNIHLNGGTLQITNDISLNGARTIFLGANGGTLDVQAGRTLTINGLITSEASHVNSGNGYANADHVGGATQRYTDRNPDMGDLIIDGGGRVIITGNPDGGGARSYLAPVIGGITWINEGILRLSMPSSSAAEWLGSNRSFADSTIIGADGTLELAGGNGGDIYEWFTFEGKGYLGGGTIRTLGTAQTYDFTGQLFIDSDIYINNKNGSNIYFGESTGAFYGQGDIIRGGASGEFRIYTNAPEWTGQLILGGGTNRIYGNGKIGGATGLTLSRNAYLGLGNGGTSENQFDDRLPDNLAIDSNGWTRLRMEATGGVYSGVERLGRYTARWGTAGIEVDLGADIVAGAARLPGDYAGFRFSELVRDKGAVFQFRNTDGGTSIAGGDFTSQSGGNQALFMVDTLPEMFGSGDGTNGDTKIIAGFFGGTRAEWFSDTTDQRMSDTYAARHMMTAEQGIDPTTGETVYYLRPLSDAEGSTDYHKIGSASTVVNGSSLSVLRDCDVTAAQNLRLTGIQTDGIGVNELTGRRDQIVTLGEDITINSFSIGLNVYGNGVNGSGETMSLMLRRGTTVTVNSGVLAFNGLGVQNRNGAGLDTGANLDMRGYVHGGTFDFNGQQAILFNMNRWVHYNTSDDPNAYRSEDGDNTHVRINTSITNTGGNGLIKAGGGSIFLEGANTYTGDTTIVEGTLYVRNNRALGLSERVNVVGDGQFVLGYGTYVDGVDLYVGPLNGNKLVLWSEQDGGYWGGDVILDNIDASGNAGGFQRNFTARIGNASSAIFTLGGDIYGGGLDANAYGVAGAEGGVARIFSTLTSAAGMLDIRGRVRDTATGAVGAPVTTANQNDLLRMEVVASTNENTVQLWQSYDAAGRISLLRGSLRYAGSGNFYTAAAAAAVNPNNFMSGFHMGGRSVIDSNGGSGTGDATSNSNLGFFLANGGTTFNLSSWTVGGDPYDPENLNGNDNWGRGNNIGNSTLGGENRSGEVIFGTGTGTVTFTPYRTAGSNRDLRLYATKGGEVTMRVNFIDGGNAVNTVNTSLTKVGSGRVNLQGSSAGGSTVEGLNVLGGVVVMEGYGSNLNRRVGNGARLLMGGGILVMDGSEASFTENFGSLTLNQGGNGIAALGNGLGAFGTISIGGTGITRNAGGTLHLQSIAGGLVRFSDAAMASRARLGSFATFGSGVATSTIATDWAATDAAGNVIAFTGYATDTFGAGQHTDITSAGLAGGITDSVRFNSAAGTIATGNLVLNDGGILITSNHTGGTAMAAGVGITTSGTAVDLLVHNYASSAVTIAGDISGGQNVVFTGSGETVLSGTNTYTGTTHLNGAAIVSVDGIERFGATSGFVMNGGTLRYTGTAPSSVLTAGVVLGGNDGNIDVTDVGGVFVSKAVFSSDANVISTYGTNPNSGGLFITGAGTFQMGNRATETTVADVAGVMNTYTGVTVIGDGVQATRVDVQGMTNDSGNNVYITPFGTTEGWADGTIVRNNATLELSPKRGDVNHDSQIRLREWLQFGESAADNVTLRMTTQREVAMDGMVHVVGNLLIEVGNGGYADANGTGNGTLTFGANEGGLYGDGNIIINGDGTVSFRSSIPNFTGSIDIQDGNLNVYGNGLPFGSGTSPIMMGLNGETGQVRLLHLAENGSNSPTTAFDSGATDYTIARDIIVRNTSQDVRIGGGYYALNGTVRFTGKIQLGDGGPGSTPTVRLYYEDTEGLDQAIYGVQQQTILEFSGGFSGAGNLLIDVNEGGSANDTIHDIYGIFHFTADNSAWTGMLDIGADTGTSSNPPAVDTDDTNVVRLGHVNALNDNLVRFRNSGILQMAGLSKIFTQNFLFIGGAGFHTSSRIENAGPVDAWVTFHSLQTGLQYQDIGVGLADGTYWTDLGNVTGKLGVIKTGSGNTVLGASTGGGNAPGSFSSYSGDTRILEGILYAGSNNAFSPNSRFVVSDNAELSLYWDDASAGFDNMIGSLVGAILARVDIQNSTFRVGGDGTHDADFAGVISGAGNLYKVGAGTQRLSGTNTFSGNVAVSQGTLVGGGNNAFGDDSNIIYLGGFPNDGNNPLDARVELLLDGAASAVNQTIVMNAFDGNDEGIVVIGTRATSGTYGLTSSATVEMAQNLFAESAGTSTFRFGGAISDSGSERSIIKVGSGTVELAEGNVYGPAGVAGAAINGGTVIRHGTLTISNEFALASTVVEMGDTHRALSQNAYLATTKSLISPGAGSFDASSNGAGGAGTGAFLNVKAEVDGVAITSADVGKWILVKDEGLDPERNGVYRIVSVDPTCGQMNLVRASEFDDSTEMLYGTSVGVTSGTYAGLRYFMGSKDITSVNADNTDPVHWMAETGNPDIALLATQSGMLISNAFDINDTNGSGTTTIGGTFTTGTTTFEGSVTLQHHSVPGVDNLREIVLTSASNDDDGTGARGTIFSGVISEADAGDTLSVRVTGPGTVTMSNDNTYKGKTTVASGTLALEGAGSISQTSWLEVAQGAKFDMAAVSGGDYTLDTVVSGSGTIVTGSGKFTVGTNGGVGVLRPGMSSNPSDVGTAGNLVGTLTVTGNLELAGSATGTERLVLQLGTTNGADYNDAANFGGHLAAGTFSTYLQSQADTYDTFTGGNHDRVVITGSLELHAGGQIVVSNSDGSAYSPMFGDVFNLLDWAEGMLVPNDFDSGSTNTFGGLNGDLDLPTLSGGLFYDTSLFASHGIFVVVPEPGRVLLLMLGLICLIGRRRR
ncbi:autotransporter-associated beta strand repeat-containing protein [Roseimicrobium gellanilyticum]|nr:autotransporter-associated beta strand repeat-containing protein [Roseimicrobium gellanilyticum]